MILNLILVLIIAIVLLNTLVYNHIYKCPQPDVKIKYVRGSRLPRALSNDKIFDSIDLKLDRDVPCGIYNLKNTYGNAIMFVSKYDKRVGYLTMKNMNYLTNIDMIDLWDLDRIESKADGLIKTYNSGCC